MAMLIFQMKDGVPLPSPPSNPGGSSGDGEVTVSWDAVPEADNYTVYFDTSPGVTDTDSVVPGTPTTNTSVVHSGLVNGTTYYYVVKSTNAGGDSTLSAEISETPAAPAAGGFRLDGPVTYASKMKDMDPPVNTGGMEAIYTGAIHMAHDGNTMWAGDNGGGNEMHVYKFVLSSAFDVTTASFSQTSNTITIDPGTGFADFKSLFLKPDGTHIYVLGGDGEIGDRIVQYPLSTPWDLSSIGSRTAKVSLGALEFGNGLHFDPTGTYVFFASDGAIKRWTLGTPWVMASPTAVQTFNPSGITSFMSDMTVSEDGMKVFATVAIGSESVLQWNMTSAFDLSTANATPAFSYNPPQFGVPGGMTWKWDDGLQMYVTTTVFDDETAEVYTYNTP